MILYQYRGKLQQDEMQFLEALLTTGELKFTSPSEFNDPFDCCPTHFADLEGDHLPSAVMHRMNSDLQRASGKLHGMVCLTPHADDILMWSHYGSHHRGVCVGFDAAELRSAVPRNDLGHPLYFGPVKVSYARARPAADSTDAFTTKAECWKYEDEYRLISVRSAGKPAWGPGIWRIPTSAIKVLVLGSRISDGHRDKLLELANAARHEVRVQMIIPAPMTFELLIEDPSSQPDVRPMRGVIRGPNGTWETIE